MPTTTAYLTGAEGKWNLVDSLLREFVEALDDELSTNEMTYQYESSVEEIESDHRDGFIPFTNGGYHTIKAQDIYHDIGSGAVPLCLQEWADRLQEDCHKSFMEEHGFDPYETDDDEKREKFYEYENEWFSEGIVYYWKVRAMIYRDGNHHKPDNAPGGDVVLFDAYICDDEYGRDSISWLSHYGGKTDRTHGTWSKCVPLSDITQELIDCLVKEAFDHLESL